MSRKPALHGLRVTVRQDEDVVEQEVLWRWDAAGLIWTITMVLVGVTFLIGLVAWSTGMDVLGAVVTGTVAGLLTVIALMPVWLIVAAVMRLRGRTGVIDLGSIPTPTGGPLARYHWVNRAVVGIEGATEGAGSRLLGPTESWSWAGEHGIRVDLDLIPIERAPRFGFRHGQVAFITMVMMLMNVVMMIGVLQDWVSGQATAPAAEFEPNPELIARLLQRDYDGEDDGLANTDGGSKDGGAEHQQRPEHEQGFESFYMPSGSDGPMTRTGGGAVAGDEVERTEPEEEVEDAIAEAAEPEPEPEVIKGTPPSVVEPEAPPMEQELPGELAEEQPPEEANQPRSPMERFVGWGFRDWFEVRDARQDTERQIARQLDLVRHRLRIDPTDPGALNTLGYYAYLAENRELSRQTYERYVELYPDDPVGYNNLALTYKRSGEYTQEEALYRKALEMDPLDTHVLNNLAVNLAHQQRYEEALEVMDMLEELDPGDPYADLHRAKIYAARGKHGKAYEHLERALQNVERLDTMHHIEFRQDIRLDPAFDSLRGQSRFRRILERYYGEDADYLVTGPEGRYQGRSRG